ncbi:hypothetical protein PRZ48_010735 [Zasmidium cellare]|uniref:prolyl oligopeptidase n=1 Tax=Zasmidium cellare TaxID=395010 RepID=A0ABR0E9I8_ZASCE|nr:hypothetical protein PRZ48_010735 [Zasmidium cellare]
MTLNKPYPSAPRSNTKEHFQSANNGSIEVANPYDWLQNLDSPETKAFVEAQNAAFQDFLPDTDPTILGAKQKIGGILMNTYSDYFVTSAPKFVGDSVFLRVLGRGKPFGATYRWRKQDFLQETALNGDEVVAEPSMFHDESVSGNAIISSAFSQGGKFWAYNEAVSGSDWGIIRVKSVDDSSLLPDEIHDSKFNTKPSSAFAWLGDLGFFYQFWLSAQDTNDGKRRPQLKFHRLGTPQSSDEVVYEEEDHPERTFRASVNDAGSVVVLEIFGATATSKVKLVKIIPGAESLSALEWQSLCDDLSAEWEYLGEDSQTKLQVFWTNAQNGKIVGANIDHLADLKVIVPSAADQVLKSAKLLPDGTILAVRSIDVEDELQAFDTNGQRSGTVETPAKTIVDISHDTDGKTVFIMESSFCYAPRLWSARRPASETKSSGKPVSVFAKPTAASASSTISSKRFFYKSSDGTRVPLFITSDETVEITAKTPVLLYIYGGFGISLIPHFRPEFLAFIRGFRGILATANIRGGSEYGRAWYEAACKEKRQTLFDDIIGAARHIHSDVTKSTETPVILMGESMGALNSCSVMVQQPDLLSGIILNAGAFDILHRREMGIRGRGAEDIGDPYDPVQFDFIRRWEPVHNLKNGQRYPPVLLTAGNQDDLVSMAHSLKMTAALQYAAQGVNGAGIDSQSSGPHGCRSARAWNPHGITDSTLQDLVRFFVKKLIYFVPILDGNDLDDITNVVTHKRPLALCASLVASIFVPGGASVRQMLIPRVVEFLEQLEGPTQPDNETIWMQLQAYAILYAYRPSTDISNPSLDNDSDRRLNHWRLKSAIEDFAMRLGLHRALDEVRLQVKGGEENISDGYAFRKGTYWLWLFTMSHHFALVTETPPTIRQDNSIKSACSLLSHVSKPPRVTRMLAEVDLCMLWNLADLSLPGLAEWWCAPPEDLDPEEATRVLDDADAALDVWSRRWGLHGETDATYPGLDTNNGAVDYHFRATRFWLRTFATRIVHHQSHWNSNTTLNVNLTLKSAEAAEAVCRFLSDIPPLTRDSARYMSDFGWALLAFCGIYIIRIYELFGRAFPVLEHYMTTVEACAKLLIEMAVGSNQIPRIYGERVLDRFNAVMQNNLVENGIDHQAEDLHVDLQWVDDVFQQASALTG